MQSLSATNLITHVHGNDVVIFSVPRDGHLDLLQAIFRPGGSRVMVVVRVSVNSVRVRTENSALSIGCRVYLSVTRTENNTDLVMITLSGTKIARAPFAKNDDLPIYSTPRRRRCHLRTAAFT